MHKCIYYLFKMEEDDPFLEAYNDILTEEKKDNLLNLKEDEEDNPINNEKDQKNQDETNNTINNKNVELSPSSFLEKKRKQDNDLDSLQISAIDNNKKDLSINNKSEPIKEYTSISYMINENNNVEEYDYGYSIILLNEGETGLIEDFLNEKQYESTTEDYFNYDLDEEKWIKILNHSIYIHYERHIKEEIEKRKKIQANQPMLINNGNNANQQMVPPMNQMMFMNFGNNVNYQQLYLQNLKNIPAMTTQYNYPK